MSDKLRSLMPGLKDKLYFNYGGQGPLPSPSLNETDIVPAWVISKKNQSSSYMDEDWPIIALPGLSKFAYVSFGSISREPVTEE